MLTVRDIFNEVLEGGLDLDTELRIDLYTNDGNLIEEELETETSSNRRGNVIIIKATSENLNSPPEPNTTEDTPEPIEVEEEKKPE